MNLAEAKIVESDERTRRSSCTPLKRDRTPEYLRHRTVCQTPISYTKYCVIYIVNGKEKRSPWLYRRDHAYMALNAMRKKYGERKAILFRD